MEPRVGLTRTVFGRDSHAQFSLQLLEMRLFLVLVVLAAAWATEDSLASAKPPGRSLARRNQRVVLQDLRRLKRKQGGGRKSVFDPVRGDSAFRQADRRRGMGSMSRPTRPAFPAFPMSSSVASPTSFTGNSFFQNTPVTPPSSSSFTGDSFFRSSSSKGKGSKGRRGKGSRSRGSSKGSKGGSSSGSSSSSSSSGRRGGESSKKGRRPGDICSRFEFQFDRRHLQFQGASCQNNVFDLLSSMGNLSIFADLLAGTGLSQIFSCGGPFTVLAPTNDAFVGLDPPTSLTQIEDFLLGHIIPGVLMEADFGIGVIESLAGSLITVDGPRLSFNSANAVDTDIVGCNGVLFLTDSIVTNFGMCLLVFSS